MQAISRKLKNSQGATMLLAMLLMLVAMTVSIVILSASVTAASNVRPVQAQQQAYLTVSSAAEAFYTSLKGEGGKFTLVRTVYYEDQGLSQEKSHSFSKPDAPNVPYGQLFKDSLTDLLKAWSGMVGTSGDPSYAESFTVSTSDGEIGDVNLTLKVAAKMEGNRATGCILTAEFSTADSDGSLCRIQVRGEGTIVAGVREFRDDPNGPKTETDLMVTWKKITIGTPKTSQQEESGQ